MRMIDFNLIERIFSLSTTHFCDADLMQNIGIFNPEIKALNPHKILCGFAHTVQADDSLVPMMKALQEAKACEVIVINDPLGKNALFGEIFCTEAKNKELAGFVTDGACRDVMGIQELEFPVYTKEIVAQKSFSQNLGTTQIPITCGGIQIHPGDLIFGDANGLIAIKLENLKDLIEKAEAILKKEQAYLISMAEGKSFFDIRKK